jgi:3-oxoacyl-[acyl-carrier protein] reductase
MFDVRDRVIVVTGGALGLGKVYSTHLAGLGAHVVIADIDAAAVAELGRSITAEGRSVLEAHVDVTKPEMIAAMKEATIARWGRIDGLVNNAALMSVLPRRSWHEIEPDEWDRVMAVNLRGMFECCRAVFPAMRDQQAGKIVNISSGRVFEGVPHRLHYTTSKAGVIGFTRALAREVGEFNICVNALSPGLTLSETQIKSSSQNYLSAHSEGRAIKRPQVPNDLLGALVFLLSSASDFMTGQTVNVDGGRVMH